MYIDFERHKGEGKGISTLVCRGVMAEESKEDLRCTLLRVIESNGALSSWEQAQAGSYGMGHTEIVGALKSLASKAMVTLSTGSPVLVVQVLPEGAECRRHGAPECRVLEAVGALRADDAKEGVADAELSLAVGPAVAPVGKRVALKNKWIAVDKGAGGRMRPLVRVALWAPLFFVFQKT